MDKSSWIVCSYIKKIKINLKYALYLDAYIDNINYQKLNLIKIKNWFLKIDQNSLSLKLT